MLSTRSRSETAILVTGLETRYLDWGGKWDAAGLENIGVSALGDSLMIRARMQREMCCGMR